MKPNTLPTAILLALLMALRLSATAADPATSDAAQPSADVILKQMSDKLGAARQFSFKATREISPDLATKERLQARASIEVKVMRPNGVAAVSASKDDVRSFYADGRTLTMVDGKENMYATVPMRASLDALPDALAATYGIVPPLAEFVISNPYAVMKYRAATISYGGKVTWHGGFLGLKSVECHRLLLTGRYSDSELWIAVSDSLPRQTIATLKGSAAQGTVKIKFKEWNLAATLPAQTFAFTPPPGSEKIPMITTAEARAEAKRTH